jgi:hypothetical protein
MPVHGIGRGRIFGAEVSALTMELDTSYADIIAGGDCQRSRDGRRQAPLSERDHYVKILCQSSF